MEFAITICAVVFCLAAVTAKNSREIKELQNRIDSPLCGPTIEDNPEDLCS